MNVIMELLSLLYNYNHTVDQIYGNKAAPQKPNRWAALRRGRGDSTGEGVEGACATGTGAAGARRPRAAPRRAGFLLSYIFRSEPRCRRRRFTCC